MNIPRKNASYCTPQYGARFFHEAVGLAIRLIPFPVWLWWFPTSIYCLGAPEPAALMERGVRKISNK